MSDLVSNWGKTRKFLVTVSDLNGAIDLTGKTLKFAAKVKREDPDPPVLTKSTGGSGITLSTQAGATLGQATIQIDPSDTRTKSAFHPARSTVMDWDLELVDGTDRYIVDSGVWTVAPSVGRL